jgi:AraC-like DNA-binding protein
MQPVGWYREFVPCEALRADVYALFSFVPGTVFPPLSRPLLRTVAFRDASLCAPQFADAHASIVFELGRVCDRDGRWRDDSNCVSATVIGPMSGVGRTGRVDLPVAVGAYFRPARVAPLFGAVPELIDRAVPLADLWGTRGSRVVDDLCDLDEAARLERMESMLLSRLRQARDRTGAIDVAGLAASVLRTGGRVRIAAMARAAGVSRQHLSRAFRERVGIGPKLYASLARFQSLLRYAGPGTQVDWAAAALDLGFADQSHMIAECRRFSGLTPQALADRDWFHPFIERARSAPRLENRA